MYFSTLASIAAVLVIGPINVFGGETYVPPPMSVSSSPEGYPTSTPPVYPTSTSPVYPTSTPTGYPTSSPTGCVTITETEGPSCPTLTCARPDCIQLKTITLECGCASIYSTTECATTCGGCATSYDTLYLPCATSLSSSSSGYETTTTTSTSTSYSMSSSPSYPTYPTTSWGNSTMTTTTTNIITISTCPASCTCTGQTTTWSGTTGPTTCPPSSTCSCVLPGGPMTTITETTVTTPGGEGPAPTTTPGNTGPTPTSSSSSTPSQVQPGGAGKVGGLSLADGSVLVGLIAAAVGML